MRRVQVVYFDAGGGHRNAACALEESIRLSGRDWDVRCVNLDEVLEPADLVRKATGRNGPEWYNWSLRRGWTSVPVRLMPAVRRYIRAMLPQHIRLLREHWRRTAPELVVSVMPHYNRAIFESLKQELPTAPMATVLTDFADCPPNFWFELQDQHFICGSARAVQQAKSLGIRSDRIWRVSAMIVHPRFYCGTACNRAQGRERIGLSPLRPTVLVSFGGYGSARMVDIAKRLRYTRAECQAIFVCGRNAALVEALERLNVRYGRHVEGFTTDMDDWMRLSDVFIGKPGPGSVSEAVAAGLPVIVEQGYSTMPQERYTAEWIAETRTGLVIQRFQAIAGAVDQLLRPGALDRMRANVRAVNNRAVFEIPEILERIMAESPGSLDSYQAVAV